MEYTESTSNKEALLSYVDKNHGSKIELHFEYNLYDTWGDDGVFTYDTTNKKQLLELIDTIKTHYIHGISITK